MVALIYGLLLWYMMNITLLSAQCKDTITQRDILKGIVTDYFSHKPIPNATIRLRELKGARSYALVSGQDGRFENCAVDAGAYSVSASAPGYSSVDGIGDHTLNIVLPSVNTTLDLKLQLLPLLELSGNVVSDNGDAASGHQVEALRKVINDGPDNWVSVGLSTSDSDGRFRIGGLVAGDYLVRSTSPKALTTHPSWSMDHSYYPSGPIEAAVVIAVKDDAAKDLTIVHRPNETPCHVLKLDAASSIRIGTKGTWRVSVARRFEQATVTLGSRQIESSVEEIRFCGLSPGDYTVDAAGFDGDKGLVTGTVTASLPKIKSTSVTLPLSVAPPLHIRLISQATGAVDGSACDSGRVLVTLSPLDRRLKLGEVTERKLLPNCTASFPSVPDGRYRVEVLRLPRDLFVEAVTSDDFENSDKDVTIGAASRRDGLTITLKSGSTKIVGKIANRADITDYRPLTLLAFKHHEDGSLCRTCILESVIAADQFFVLDSIPPGSYSLVAIHELPSNVTTYSTLFSYIGGHLTKSSGAPGVHSEVAIKYVGLPGDGLPRIGWDR